MKIAQLLAYFKQKMNESRCLLCDRIKNQMQVSDESLRRLMLQIDPGTQCFYDMSGSAVIISSSKFEKIRAMLSLALGVEFHSADFDDTRYVCCIGEQQINVCNVNVVTVYLSC